MEKLREFYKKADGYIRKERYGNTLTKTKKAVPAPRGEATLRDRAVRAALEARRRPTPSAPLGDRLKAHICATYTAEVRARGGETEIQGKDATHPLELADREGSLILLRAEGWRQYGSRARLATLAYLCGLDDNGRFAVRVPGTAQTIREAVDALTPAEVRRAQDDGRGVLRQGDVYIVELRRGPDNMGALAGTRHAWDASARTIRHVDDRSPHAELHVPWPAKAVMQTALQMGRGGGRGEAD